METTSEITVEYVNFKDIEKWPRNPKDHDLHEIRKSFYRFGFIKPVLVDEGTGQLVAGHGRLDTLKILKDGDKEAPKGVRILDDDTWLVPVLRGVKFDSPDEAEAFLIADNRLSEIGGWNSDLLSEMLGEVVDVDGALDGIGFDIADVMEMIGEPTRDEEKEPTLDLEVNQEKWKVKSGDIWAINNHKIMCGDCREVSIIDELFGDNKIQGVITSPPYARQRKDEYGGVRREDYIDWFFPVQENIKSILNPKGHFLLNINPHSISRGSKKYQKSLYIYRLVIKMVDEWEWCLMDEYCWPHSVFPRVVVKKFRNSWEPIFWFTLNTDYIWYPEEVRIITDTAVTGEYTSEYVHWNKIQGTGKHNLPKGGRGLSYPSNILKCKVGRAVGHPAAFPIGLPLFFMKCCSLEGELWFDPFCGSGTSIFAAEETKRVCYGIERLPNYVSLILQLSEDKKMRVEKIK